MPNFGELKRYLDRNGWTIYRKTDHWYYKKTMDDGTVLTTRVSHALGKEIPHYIWKKILVQQLHITQDEFNRGK